MENISIQWWFFCCLVSVNFLSKLKDIFQVPCVSELLGYFLVSSGFLPCPDKSASSAAFLVCFGISWKVLYFPEFLDALTRARHSRTPRIFLVPMFLEVLESSWEFLEFLGNSWGFLGNSWGFLGNVRKETEILLRSLEFLVKDSSWLCLSLRTSLAPI